MMEAHNAMLRSSRQLIALACLTLLAAHAQAQDLVHKAPPQIGTTVLTNGVIHTISGETVQGGIAFADGRIIAIGSSQEMAQVGAQNAPQPIVRIDLEGRHVFPGMIAANSVLGLMEVGAVRATIDVAEVGNVSPEVRASVGVNSDSTLIPVTRSSGVLTALVLPSGGAIPGRASVMRLEGWTWEDMTVVDDAGLVIAWPRVRPITAWWMQKSEEEQLKEAKENMRAITEAFDAADAYLAARASDPSVDLDLRWEAMGAALRGEKPVFIQAQEMEQIESAVSFARERGLKAVLIGGRDAALCSDLLRSADVGVILTGSHRMPRRRDTAYDSPFTLAARLESAGVRWCLATGGGTFQTPHLRNLPDHAGTCVAYGLSPEAALRSITLSPAELLGVGAELGSLDAGKRATLIVTNGDVLEIASDVEMAFIDGRAVDLQNKQTALAEKYREKYRQLGLIP